MAGIDGIDLPFPAGPEIVPELPARGARPVAGPDQGDGRGVEHALQVVHSPILVEYSPHTPGRRIIQDRGAVGVSFVAKPVSSVCSGQVEGTCLTLSNDCVHNRCTIGGRDVKFISVRELRGKSADIWKALPDEREMVITNNGRPVAILAAVSESNLEESLAAFRQARAIAAVANLQRRSVQQGADKITMDDIDAEIGAVRLNRQR